MFHNLNECHTWQVESSYKISIIAGSYLFFFFSFNFRAKGKLLTNSYQYNYIYSNMLWLQSVNAFQSYFWTSDGIFNLLFSLVHSRFSSLRRSGENAGLLGCQQLYGFDARRARPQDGAEPPERSWLERDFCIKEGAWCSWSEHRAARGNQDCWISESAVERGDEDG